MKLRFALKKKLKLFYANLLQILILQKIKWNETLYYIDIQ